MKLTTKGKYALQALLDLRNNLNGKPIRIQDIAERQKISIHYLEQLFRKLRQNQIVKSIKGPNGGYVLGEKYPNCSVSFLLTTVGESIEYYESLQDLVNKETNEYLTLKAYVIKFDEMAKELLNTLIKDL